MLLLSFLLLLICLTRGLKVLNINDLPTLEAMPGSAH